MKARSDSKRKAHPAPDTKPKPWMRGWGVRWVTCHYVHGDGLLLRAADRVYELVPYTVAGNRGEVVGYAIQVDGARYGFTRIPGPIEQAIAVAELMLTEEGVKASR